MSQAAQIALQDDNKKVQATVTKLYKKYTKKRTVNEKVLNQKKPYQKVISVITSVLCGVLVAFCLMFCFSNIYALMKHVAPSFAGYSTMRVSSGSMVKSGFNIGDTIVIKSVDTKSLGKDDMIAFYTYSKSYYGVNKDNFVKVEAENITNKKSNLTFAKFFGIQNSQLQEAAGAGAMLTFHHIREVYEDENGQRWFSTYGSSNAVDDTWLIKEDLVVGKYDSSNIGKVIASIITFASSTFGIFTLVVVVFVLVLVFLLKQCIHDIQIAKLELDIVEEKRKLTDEICIKHKVGFGMDTKTKYKVLAQAKPEDVNLYLSLLWEDGSAPASIRKYYIRKKLLLSCNSKLRILNQECEKLFKEGKNPSTIAKYYSTQKEIIKTEYKNKVNRIKVLRKKYNF